MQRTLATLAAVSALLAVAAGAFGVHGLEAMGDPRAAGLFQTASRYQMWHAIAALALLALNGVAWRPPA